MDAELNQKEIERLISRKELDRAEEILLEKTTIDGENPDSQYLLGVVYHLTGRLGQAIERLKKSLELDPKHTDAAICLSVLYNDIGKYDEAKSIFQKANQSVLHTQNNSNLEAGIDRKFSVKHLELADLYFRYRRWDEAIEEYTKAHNLNPNEAEVKIRRAKAFAKKGFVTRAIQELQQLRDDRPDLMQARIQLGLLHYSQGNHLDAELEWEEVLKNDPENSEVKSYLEMARSKSRPGAHMGPRSVMDH